MNAAPQQVVDGNLYAPQDGRILRGLVNTGADRTAGRPRILAAARKQGSAKIIMGHRLLCSGCKLSLHAPGAKVLCEFAK